MRLIDLEPHWVGAGGEGIFNADGTPAAERRGVGISFLCPCGRRDEAHPHSDRVFIGFENPLDGGPAYDTGGPHWRRDGETFETLTLSPSILRADPTPGACRWHGYVRNGLIETC